MHRASLLTAFAALAALFLASPSFAQSITSFSPTSGPVGTSVTIMGTGFTGTTAVKFNGTTATFSVASSTSITVTVPSGAATGTFTVTTPGGSIQTTATFTVTAAMLTVASLTLMPNPIAAGDTAQGAVTLSGNAPMGGTVVNLSSSNTAAATVGMSVTVPAGANTVTFPINAVAGPGSSIITVTLGASTQTAMLMVNPVETAASANYNVSMAPINVDVVESVSGSSSATTVATITPVNSFAGNVGLSTSNLPSGVSDIISTPNLSITSGAASSNLNFTVANTTRPGFYPVNLIATSGGMTHSYPINLTVSPPPPTTNFTVTEDVDALEIEPGSSDTVSLTLNPGTGFTGTVTLALHDDPAAPIINSTMSGINANFSMASLNTTNLASVLTFQIGPQVPEGAYHLLITGTSAAGTQTLVQTIFVLPSSADAGYGQDPNEPSSHGSPDYALANSASDMTVYDLGSSSNAQAFGSISKNAQSLVFSSEKIDVSSSKMHPHYLGATDDRIYIRDVYPSGPIPYPFSTVCKIVVHFPSGYTNSATGTLIGRNHVLTAAHILYDTSDKPSDYVIVYPGYENRPSRTYHHALVRSYFVPNNYKLELTNPDEDARAYDDWAVLDCYPVVGATKTARGRGLGEISSYMYASDDFVSPDDASTIAGYPGSVNGVAKDANYMYFSATSIGDDGPVTDTIPGDYVPSDNLVYHTIDVSEGDSGASIYRPDPAGNDYMFHLFAVQSSAGLGYPYNVGTLITTTRKNIIQSIMRRDGDDIFSW